MYSLNKPEHGTGSPGHKSDPVPCLPNCYWHCTTLTSSFDWMLGAVLSAVPCGEVNNLVKRSNSTPTIVVRRMSYLKDRTNQLELCWTASLTLACGKSLFIKYLIDDVVYTTLARMWADSYRLGLKNTCDDGATQWLVADVERLSMDNRAMKYSIFL